MSRHLLRLSAALAAAALIVLAPFAALAAPIPGFTPSPSGAGTALTNEPYTAQACFDNLSATDTGYQPMYQTVVPPGSTLGSAQFLTFPLALQTVGTCNVAGGCPTGFTNPRTGATVPLQFGETLVLVGGSSGSFAPAQPPACVTLSFALGDATVAPLGVTRNIQITPLFAFGADPLDNPQSDPPIVGSPAILGVTPSVIRLSKAVAAPESETATGPNYPRTYTLTLDIADAQVITDIDLTDVLPNTLQYVAGTAAVAGCTAGTVTELSTPGATPGGTLTRRCSADTGTTATNDLVLTFQAYVPQNDAVGAAIVTPAAPVNPINNQGTVAGTYDPPGPTGSGPIGATSNTATLNAKLLTLRKGVAVVIDTGTAGPSPGDTLEYTLTFDLSDYHSVSLAVADPNRLKFTDVLGDGQTVAGCTGLPSDLTTTIAAQANGLTLSATPMGAACTATAKAPDGTTTITLDAASALQPVYGDTLYGDLANDAVQSAPTTVTMKFRTTIDSAYVNPPPPPTAPQLTLGDSVGNAATGGGASAGTAVTDPTSASATIVNATFAKSIYAYTDLATAITHIPPPPGFLVSPGDSVTYRLTWTLPLASFEIAKIDDFLPSPVFDAAQITASDPAAARNPLLAPANGRWTAGPLDTFTKVDAGDPLGLVLPALATSGLGGENRVTWNYGTYIGQQTDRVVDLLFTVAATTRPFADALNLLNLAQLQYQNTIAVVTASAAGTVFTTRAPLVTIEKSIVASSNASCVVATAPANYDSARSGCDAGDQIDFRLKLANGGRAPAYNVRVDDDGGFPVAGFNGSCSLQSVTQGDGTTPVTATGSLFDTAAAGGLTIAQIPADTDPAVLPAEQVYVNYRCIVGTSGLPGPPSPNIDNTARLKYYSSDLTQTADPLYNHASNQSFPGPNVRKARVALVTPLTITKAITGSSVAGTAGGNVNAGETLDYRVIVTLAEGRHDGFQLADSRFALPAGWDCSTSGITCANVAVTGATALKTATVPATTGTSVGTITWTYTSAQLYASGSNTASAVEASLTGPVTATTSWTLVSPTPAVSKNFNPSAADAGDTVQIRLGWSNANANSPMFQCVITDAVNTTLFDPATLLAVNTPTGYAYAANTTTGVVTYTATDTTSACPTVAANGAVFRVQLRNNATTGGAVSNTASLAGNTLPAPQAGGVAVNASATAALSLAAPATNPKTIYTTSEPDTNVSNVAVGEVLTYRLPFTLPDGVTQNVRIVDDMQGGLANLAYVPGSARLARNTLALTAANGGGPGGINSAAVNTFVDVPVQCAGSAPCAANEVRIDLGNVTNDPAIAGSPDTYTLELKFRVQNVAANQGGSTRANRGQLIYRPTAAGADQTLSGTAVTATVVAPVVQIQKSASPGSIAGGGTITYTLTVRNNASGAGAGPAYEFAFADTLPPELLSPALVLPLPPGVTAAFTGNVLGGTVTRLDPSTQVQLQYTATVDPATPIGRTIVNAANTRATSLPGPCGTGGDPVAPCTAPQGDPGTSSGERTGAGGAVNNLAAATAAPFTTASINVSKALLNPQARYAIGDTASYEVRVALPVGTAKAFRIRDTLPAGLTFDTGSATVATLGGPVSFTGTPTPPGQTGQTLTFAFGDVATATGAGEIVVRYTATIANVIGNQNNVPLLNSAVALFEDPQNAANTITSAAPTNPTVRVGEPNLTIAKSITAGAAGADAGNAVDWSLTISNGGTTAAHRTDVRDVLPPGLYNIANVGLVTSGAVTLNGTATPLALANVRVKSTVSPNDTIEVAETAEGDASDTIAIAPGASLTITYRATVMNTVTPGQVLTNAVRVPFASQPGCGTPGVVCRDNSSDPGNVDDDNDTQLDNYEESGSASLTIRSNIAIDKQVSPAAAPVGATVTFTQRIDLIEGTIPNVVFSDTLPAGLTYISHSISVGNLGMVLGSPTYNDRLGSGQLVQFDFGTIGNPANGNNADDFVQIEIVVRIDNVAANQNNVARKNGEQAAGSLVTVSYGSGPPTTVTFDADGATPGIQGRALTVQEPVLATSKVVAPTSQALGDVVTYSITVSHAGASTANAFDAVLTDTLPSGVTFVPGSVNPPGVFGGIAGQVLSFNVGTLTLAASAITISYQARIAPSAVVGAPLTNTVAGSYASLPGANGGADSGRTGSGGINDYTLAAAAAVTPNQSAAIYPTKTVVQVTDNGNGILEPGERIEYTVVLTNTSATTLTNVRFVDSVPPQTAFVAGTLSSTLGTAIESGAPNLTVSFPNLGPNASATIRFRAEVNAGVPAGTVISNQGSVDSDQTVPTPTDADGVPGNGAQPTLITVGGTPTPAAALYAEKLVALQADSDASGSITQGDRMRYTIVLYNIGGGTLTNVAFSDIIPAGLAYVGGSASASIGAIGVAGSTVSWSGIGPLAAGAAVSALFDVTIASVTPPSQTFVNQGAATSTETGGVLTDSNGNPSDGNQPTQFVAIGTGGTAQPLLDVQKRWTVEIDTPPIGVTSPGDTLQYTITVANSGSTAATNVRLSDPVPTCSGTLNPCTAYVAGSLATSQGAIITEAPVDVNIGTLAAGGFVTVTFRVLVDPLSANGIVVANQASVTRAGGSGSSLSDDNGNPADGINPTLTPISTVPGGSGYPSALSKQLVGSSEAASTSPGVLIGEVLRYRVGIAMPKGTTRQVAIEDVLPAGFAYLPGSARLARSFETGLSASANPGGINAAPSGTFVALADGTAITIGAGASGTTVLDVFLGDVIDSDADGTTPESYTLEYRAIVRNVAGNQASTSLANAATVRFWNTLGQSQSLTPVAVTQAVIEPAITVTKAATPGSLLTTGGTTLFTLTISNAVGAAVAPAFDLVLSDVLPAAFTSVGARSITATGATNVVDLTAGTSVGVGIARLDPGGSVTVQFSATAPGPIAPGAIVNSTNATWTSLPGANGSAADGAATPGAPGTPTGERIGTGGDNDYAATASATVAVGGVAIAKSLVNPQPRYAIGDPITYRVDITVPGSAFGPLPDVVLTDILAPGLSYLPGSLAIGYGGVTASTPPADFARTDNAPGAGQETLVAAFGTLTNSDTATATVTLTYRAHVDNVLSNQSNTSLGNQASLAFTDNGAGGVTATRGPVITSITVGEPFLALSKALTSPAAGLTAGSTAAFIVTVGNSGTTTAFETVLTDALPAGLYFPAGALVTVAPSNVSGNLQVPTVAVGAGGWQTSAFDLPVGDQLTFTFTATLAATVQPGQALQNSVAATYTSRDGADPNERDGSSPGSVQTDDTLRDNYNVAASAAPVTVADPIAIAKAFHPNAAQSRYAVGQLAGYRLTLSVLEGTTRSVRVTDTLPAGMTFVSAGSPGTTPGAPITFTYSGSPTVAGQVITFDLGDVIDQPNGNVSDDFVTIDLTARIDNVTANQDGFVLGNHLRVTFVDAGGVTRTRDFDADAGRPGVQPLDLAVIEPLLALTKAADPVSQSLGDLVTFTLTVAHSAASRSDAFAVQLVDTLPAGLAFESGSVNPPGLFGGIAGQALTLDVGTLTLAAASRTITYRARVRATAPPGVAQTNMVEATWGSIPGATGSPASGRNGSGGLNDYTTSAQATVTPNINAQIVADKTVAMVLDADSSGNLTGGDTIEWTIVLTNTGSAVTGVVFTDDIPANTTFVAGSLTTTRGTPVEAPLPLTVAVGAMAAGEVVTIRFRTRVNAGLPSGTVLSNQGSVDSDQTISTLTDADGNPANGKQPTTIVVMGAPDMTIAKNHSDNFTQGQVGAVWTLVVTNAGTAPTIAPVDVADTLPAGVTANAISGVGWFCTLVPLGCSRSDMLQAGASWPPISLFVTLDPLIPAGTIVNTAQVSGGGEAVTTNNTATDAVDVQIRTLLPPAVTKTVIEIAPGVLEWRIVVVNNANTLPLTIRMIDPIPRDLAYDAGSLSCEPAGSTTVTGCTFDAATNRVVVGARLGPDAGHVDAVTADNELVVVFRTSIGGSAGRFTNVASVNWDANSTGTVDDDAGQVAVSASASFDFAPAQIPIDARWMLTLLAMLLAALGLGAVRRTAQPGTGT